MGLSLKSLERVSVEQSAAAQALSLAFTNSEFNSHMLAAHCTFTNIEGEVFSYLYAFTPRVTETVARIYSRAARILFSGSSPSHEMVPPRNSRPANRCKTHLLLAQCYIERISASYPRLNS